jgi:hypothetical protein
VGERLKLQPLFDGKVHKNEQLWDRLIKDYEKRWLEDREKSSIRDKFEREQGLFRSFCRLRSSFRAGRSSGLSTDEQEKALFKLRGVAHDLFIDNRYDERPLSSPPNLYNGGGYSGSSGASASESTDVAITLEMETDSGSTECERSTRLAGSAKASAHATRKLRRGRPARTADMDAVMQQMGSMLDNAIIALGEQRKTMAQVEASERDKDRALFLDTIKLLLARK